MAGNYWWGKQTNKVKLRIWLNGTGRSGSHRSSDSNNNDDNNNDNDNDNDNDKYNDNDNDNDKRSDRLPAPRALPTIS